MESEYQYSESSSITFEWTLKDLRSLFDSTKGDKKSKVTKSIRFGNNRWQILFYANAGQTKEGAEGGFVSLYLSCEPTPEEKEAALAESGRWVREGVYRFSFELRNVSKTIMLCNSKEANNHTFTYKTANWGWAQFTRRDSVYYQSMPVKTQDAFVIICTITSSPAAPPPQTLPRQPVPKALLDTVGKLLDDPLYSDVQFVIPERGKIRNARTIWASKKLLQRAEYFQTMFNSGFVEGSTEVPDVNQTPRTSTRNIGTPGMAHSSLMDDFEDSDFEDEEPLRSPPSSSYMLIDSSSGIQELSMLLDSTTADSDKQDSEVSSEARVSNPSITPIVLATIASPSPKQESSKDLPCIPPKLRIEVQDVAYTTYRAMLYYLYTDNIVFAPLSSSFLSATHDTITIPIDTTPPTPSEGSQVQGIKGLSTPGPSRSRVEWIRDWMAANLGRPAPCSAKSMYRVADRFDLADLKGRAAQHIIKSLTVDNIAYEIFSPFAAKFEAIRKIEVEFFLNHWHDIRASDAMTNVWTQIRNGRHPGFEEVWPLIAQSLEFKSSALNISASTKSFDLIS